MWDICKQHIVALAPWAFGILADYAGTNIAIGCGIGFSILAALVNTPLMWHPLMGKQKPKVPLAKRKLPGEDDELFQRILDGDIVDPELAFEINKVRGLHGKPSVVPRVKSYEEEKDHLQDLRQGAGDTFKFKLDLYDRVLAGLERPNEEEDPENLVMNKEDLIGVLNTMKGDNHALMEEASSDLGQWFGQYLADNGYTPHTTSVLLKQLFMSSFPPLGRDEEFTEDNVEEYLLKTRKVLSRHVEQEKKNAPTTMLSQSPFLHGSGWW